MSTSIKQRLKSVMVKFPRMYKTLYWGISIVTDFDGREHKKRGGTNSPKDTIYMIRPRTNGIEGLLALFVWVLRHIEYADSQGFIPVVDMKNYHTQYSDGSSNVWEWFFFQPSEISLDKGYTYKNVILSGYKLHNKLDEKLLTARVFFDNNLRIKYRNLCKTFIKISDECRQLIEQEQKRIPISDCIGVFLRGTDYVKMQPVGECIQPTAEQVVEKIQEMRGKHGENCPVFLVTEDQQIYDVISSKIDNLYTVSFDEYISDYKGETFLAFSGDLKSDKHKLGLEYLTKIELLSKCKYLVSSIASGSKAAYILRTDDYEDEFVFDLGVYS